jgi:hypothetical protein
MARRLVIVKLFDLMFAQHRYVLLRGQLALAEALTRYALRHVASALRVCGLAFLAVVHVTADSAVWTGGRLRPCACSFASRTRRNNADMGLKLLFESSALVSEMHMMNFDGCGCVLALGNPDALDERFLEVAKGRAKQGHSGRKQGSSTGGCSQSCRRLPHSERNSHLVCASWNACNAT